MICYVVKAMLCHVMSHPSLVSYDSLAHRHLLLSDEQVASRMARLTQHDMLIPGVYVTPRNEDEEMERLT